MIILGIIVIDKTENNMIIDIISSVNAYDYEDNDSFSYEKANKLIEKLNGKNKEVEKNLLLAAIDIKNDNIDEAKEKLLIARGNFDNSKYSVIKSYVCYLLGDIYSNEDDGENTLKYIEESFKYLRVQDYNEHYELISKYPRKIVYFQGGSQKAIEIVEKVLSYEDKLSIEAKFSLNNKAKSLYIVTNNYAKKCDAITKSIHYAKQLEDTIETAYTIVELGVEINIGEDREYSINLIKSALDIKVDDKQEDSEIKAFIYINLAEIYNEIGNYDEAQKSIDLSKEYEKYLSEQSQDDIKILRLVNEIIVDISKNLLEDAKIKLEEAKTLLKEDVAEVYVDKDIYILRAEALLYFNMKDYEKATELYKELLVASVENEDLVSERYSCEMLYKISSILGDLELMNENYSKLSKIIKKQEANMYADASYYISENVEKEVLLDSNNETRKVSIRIITMVMILLVIVFALIHITFKKLRESDSIDGLTQVYNRKNFEKRYLGLLNDKEDFALMIFDIDNFKSVNDTYGHQFGDEVIVRISKAAKLILEDKGEIYRYGGEEFVLIINNVKSKEYVIKLAEKIVKDVRDIKWGKDRKFTISLGLAFTDATNGSVLEKADENLYKSKNTGKDKASY